MYEDLPIKRNRRDFFFKNDLDGLIVKFFD